MANPFECCTEVSRIDELLACNERIPSIELYKHRKSAKSSSSTCSFSSSSSTSSVYIDDDKVLYNLILKETFEMEQRRWQAASGFQDSGGTLMSLLSSQLRHSILSWMLDICLLKEFQDDIFPYATMIFDKFLLTRPIVDPPATDKTIDDDSEQFNELQNDGLRHRQLYQYAACSLLISTKMRQTRISSKNFIDELVEFSRARLAPIGLTGDEIRSAEYLMLFTLNWDYALVTPNDYLPLLMRKCERVLPFQTTLMEQTQELLELCLMDSQLSQYAPSILAMSSMAVAINGLTDRIEARTTCRSLREISQQIHESTLKVNDLEQMIDVALKIEKDLRWLLTKNSSCHAVKIRNYPKALSKDPLNPKGLHLPRFSGSIQSRAVTVRGSAKKPGVTLVYKKKSAVRKPAEQLVRVHIKKDPRSTLRSIKNTLNNMRGRRDLKMLTLRRASAILKSQVDKSKKKKGSKKQKKRQTKK